MAQIENTNFSKVERRRMSGLSLDGWNNVMLACLAFLAIAAVSVLLAQYVITQLAKQEAAESQAALDKYKLTVEAKVSEARSEGIKAGETASNALLRAAELEKEAANARFETEKIKGMVAWRSIPPNVASLLSAALSAKPGAVNLRYTDGDPEALFLAIQISNVLANAKWQVAPGALKIGNSLMFGFILPDSDDEGAKTLRESFTAAGIPFTTQLPQSNTIVGSSINIIRGAPILMVGSRQPSTFP